MEKSVSNKNKTIKRMMSVLLSVMLVLSAAAPAAQFEAYAAGSDSQYSETGASASQEQAGTDESEMSGEQAGADESYSSGYDQAAEDTQNPESDSSTAYESPAANGTAAEDSSDAGDTMASEAQQSVVGTASGNTSSEADNAVSEELPADGDSLTLAGAQTAKNAGTASSATGTAASGTSVTGTATAQDQSSIAIDPVTGKKITTITGYRTSFNRKRSKPVTITAVITPANGSRTVKLQRYNSTAKKWVTISKALTEDADTATVSIEIPKKNRQRTTSKWRLFVTGTKEAKSAATKRITVITRNIKTYTTSARAACVYRIDKNGEGTLIYTKNSNVKRAQASTTKLMTAVLLVESGKLDTRTKISSHAASTAWGSGHLYAGDVFNTHDLLYAMLLPSSNDAATAVAEKVGGSEAAFVEMMNDKAEAMGWNNTHFRNPHGLDADGHYTTAAELAELTAYAYTFPEITECWATNYKQITSLKYKNRWNLWSTNAIFQYVSNFLGGKTGTEDNAGCCFTGVYKYKGQTYVTVVLGSGYGFSRWADTQKMHKYIRDYAATRY